MKILQVLAELNLAGAQIMAENLAVELKREGHAVEVVSLYSYETPIVQRLRSLDIKVHLLDKKRGLDIAILRQLRDIIQEFSPDVVHSHTYSLKYVFLASIGLRNVKLVHTVHNLADKESTNSNLLLERVLFKWKKVLPVAISPLIKNSIIKFYSLGNEAVPMIFNGIDLQKCNKKDNYILGSSGIDIIHIGRFCLQKNHDMIIDVMSDICKRYENVRLHLYGEGPLRRELEEKVKKLSLEANIIFEGLTDNPYYKLNESDIFILPSKWEGLPITLIEAMGTGLPIVATKVGGVPDIIIDYETGLLSDVEKDSIRDAIVKLIEDGELRKKIGENAFREVTRFSANNMAKEYLKVYESFVVN